MGGGDKTVPKSLEGCSMDIFPRIVIKIKAHVFLFNAYMCTFLYLASDPLYILG